MVRVSEGAGRGSGPVLPQVASGQIFEDSKHAIGFGFACRAHLYVNGDGALVFLKRPPGLALMLEHGQSRLGGVSPPVRALPDAFSECGFGYAEIEDQPGHA